jgi:mannose-6-phosphate isomerase
MNTLYPLFFKPVYKDYLWGGRQILTEFNRNEPEGIYAESWEVSDRPDGMSIVTNGPLKGKTLHDIVQSHPKALLGEAHLSDRFPLLLKLIDAHDNLSIQVHPDDERAKTYGGEAKTEAWYVLDATDDAVIYAGFNAHYPQEIVDRNLATRDILSMMHTIPVEKGDMIFIPGGRLHAIGKGCFVLEIQQNSNTTYRVYDWDRVDNQGNPRELHLDQARQVIHYDDVVDPRLTPKLLEETSTYKQWNLLSASHFEVEKWVIRAEINWPRFDQFEILFFRAGTGILTWEEGTHPIEMGTTCLLPAELSSLTVETEDDLELLRFYIP